MLNKEISSRISARMGIDSLLPMQQAMAEIKLPARVMLTAPTGSGKTLAFAIALLRALPPKNSEKGLKALIIAPTRELVLQIFEVVRVLAAPEFLSTAVYGGHSFAAEARSLEAMPDIVVGTPGRLLDHLHRGRLSLFSATTLVIDEYDKALELGFMDDMRAIAGRMKNAVNVILTSATKGDVPEFIGKVDKKLDYAAADSVPAPDVQVFEVRSDVPDKLDTLTLLLRRIQHERTIVFLNHRDAAERVFGHLKKSGFPVGLYHGGLDQQLRERALVLFENGTTPLLVSTDLAARGLDIDGVGAVVHYHLPVDEQAWTHRNGRTARMGASGNAFAIISEADKVPPFANGLKQFEMLEPVPQDIMPAQWATLYLNLGQKEKISRGDVAGFVMKKAALNREQVGKIVVKDHCAYVAVPAAKAREVAVELNAHKIKNMRVRVTQLKN